MSDGNYISAYAPDSDLDPVGDPVTYTIANGMTVEIRKNEWPDIDPEALPLDPMWGSAYQVWACHETAIEVRIFDTEINDYSTTMVSPEYITNVFLRKPTT